MQFISYLLYFIAAATFAIGITTVAKERKNWMSKPSDWYFKRKEMIKSFTFVSALFFVAGCWAAPSEQKGVTAAPVIAKVDSASDLSNVKYPVSKSDSIAYLTQWKYKEEADPMTNEIASYAVNQSPTVLNLKSPYDGGVVASITIRHQSKHNSVYLSVDRGQFMPDINGEAIKVKFDNGKPQYFSCQEASDGSSNTLFIEDANRFIYKVKHSKQLMIQALFYDNGKQTMEFGIDYLKWAH